MILAEPQRPNPPSMLFDELENGEGHLDELLETHVRSRAAIESVGMAPGDVDALRAHGVVSEQGAANDSLAGDTELETFGRHKTTLVGPESPDLAAQLGMEAGNTWQHELQAMQLSLVDAAVGWLNDGSLDAYANVLLLAAEEAAVTGRAGLAALTLRFRRMLVRDQRAEAARDALCAYMLQWPLLVDAHLRDEANQFHVQALIEHCTGTDGRAEPDQVALNAIMQQFSRPEDVETSASLGTQLLPHIGDGVYGLGQARAYLDSAHRRVARLHSALAEQEQPVSASVRSMATAIEMRITDARRVAEQQYERVRFEHAKLVSTMQVKSASAFEPVRHACEAAASASGLVVHYSGNCEGVLDSEVADAIVEPIGTMAAAIVSYGMHANADRGKYPEGSCELTSLNSSSGIRLALQLRGNGLNANSIMTDFGVSSASALIARLRAFDDAKADDTAKSQFAAACAALYAATADVGGTLTFKALPRGGIGIRSELPAWTTSTRGRLVAVGGGVVALREASIARAVTLTASAEALQGVKRVKLDGVTYPAVELSTLLGLKKSRHGMSLSQSALVVHGISGEVAVLAEGVSETMPLAVRALDNLPRLAGLVGGTVLVGREIAPVFDLTTVVQARKRQQAVHA